MTFKEKLQKEHPEAVTSWARGGCIGCPSTYGFEEKDRSRCPQTPECWTKERCTACWNREIPGSVQDGFRPNVVIADEWNDIRWLKKNPYLAMESRPLDGLSARVYLIDELHGAPRINMPGIKKVIFNDPATIVIWADGEKTVVKCQNGEPYDPEKGLAMAISKRALGNKGNYFDEIKKWTKEYEPKGDLEQLTVNMDTSGISLEAITNGVRRAREAAVEASKRLYGLGEV